MTDRQVSDSNIVPDVPTGGRRLVIPDIHGCAATFNALLDKIGLTYDDQLFLLGDYINKGPNSRGVIDTILRLQDQSFQVFALRGNHEQMLVDLHGQAKYGKVRLNIPRLHRYHGLVNRNLQILPQYAYFFENLPYYFDLGDFLLVHAGFDFSKPKPFENKDAMLWTSYFDLSEVPELNRRVIHGHNPNYLPFIQDALSEGNAIIPLDNGCVYKNKLHMGNLLCLDLDSLELTIQKNTEPRLRKKTRVAR